MKSQAMKKKFYAVCVAETVLIIAGLVCPRLLKWAEGLTMHHDFAKLSVDERRKFFLKTWLYIFLAFLAMYIVFYPGGLSVDNIAQYGQSLSGNYHDHPPVFHREDAIEAAAGAFHHRGHHALDDLHLQHLPLHPVLLLDPLFL